MSAERFAGRVALVTGGGSGIGEAVARGFCAEGGRVVLMGRTPAKLDAVAASLGAARARAVAGDHAVAADVARVVDTTLAAFGRLDVLFNNAGTFDARPVADTSDESLAHTIAANLTGPFLMARAVVPVMRRAGGGVIVLNASTLGLRPIPGAAAYAVAKAGVVMLGKALAVEEAAHGIRVLTVCPGVVETPIHLQRPGVADTGVEAFARQMDALHPLGRSGTPADVARLVLFLVSDDAGWMTGSVITVDGGIVLA